MRKDMRNLEIKTLTRKEITAGRHRMELPLFILVCIASVLLVIFAIWASTVDWDIAVSTTVSAVSGYAAVDMDIDVDEIVGMIGGVVNHLLFLIIVLPAVIPLLLYTKKAKLRGFTVKVSEKNFPEIYEKGLEFTKKLGMKKMPDIYIGQGNGVLNAFAAALFGRRFVLLHSELVDTVYIHDRDFSSINFVLAHEFAHHYYRHTPIFFMLITNLINVIPFLGKALSRAREFSCDRLAALLSETEGFEELMPIFVGRRLYKCVDQGEYLKNAFAERKGLFLWWINLNATHPIAPKRLAALADVQKKDGKLF